MGFICSSKLICSVMTTPRITMLWTLGSPGTSPGIDSCPLAWVADQHLLSFLLFQAEVTSGSSLRYMVPLYGLFIYGSTFSDHHT